MKQKLYLKCSHGHP